MPDWAFTSSTKPWKPVSEDTVKVVRYSCTVAEAAGRLAPLSAVQEEASKEVANQLSGTLPIRYFTLLFADTGNMG